jgi:hypothetical protein
MPSGPADASADLLLARDGVGPLLQRDYWAVIARCRARPSQIADDVGRRFIEYPPPDLVTFSRPAGAAGTPLALGDELEVAIRGAGRCRVRVVSRDRQTLTLATLAGHPEAGRITFGAYRNHEGAVVFHIRSRARSASGIKYLGFLTAGEPMQTNTWTDFVQAVARSFGDGVQGYVHAETRPIEEEEGDLARLCGPTYRAEGD